MHNCSDTDTSLIPIAKEPSMDGAMDHLKDRDATPLGAEHRGSYTLSIHKPNRDLVLPYCEAIHKHIQEHCMLDHIHFITVRPSPEFIYMRKGYIPSYDDQLKEWMVHILNTPCNILSISIEKGTKHTQLLHYHIIVHTTSKKNYKQYFKQLTNNATCLHKIYGYQKAVYKSETINDNLAHGIKYFNGLSKNCGYQRMKIDVYKHLINSQFRLPHLNVSKYYY